MPAPTGRVEGDVRYHVGIGEGWRRLAPGESAADLERQGWQVNVLGDMVRRPGYGVYEPKPIEPVTEKTAP